MVPYYYYYYYYYFIFSAVWETEQKNLESWTLQWLLLKLTVNNLYIYL